MLWRLLLSAAGSSVTVGLAALALFVTSCPKWLSLTIEPVSLLLAPGVLASLLFTGSHEYTETAILWVNFAFYLCAFYGLLTVRARRAARLGREFK